MKRILAIAALISLVSCSKSEMLQICVENGYDFTISVASNFYTGDLQPGQTVSLMTSMSSTKTIGFFATSMDINGIWEQTIMPKDGSAAVTTVSDGSGEVLREWSSDKVAGDSPYDIGNWEHTSDSKLAGTTYKITYTFRP